MGEGYYLLDIILFAMIAAFLILRLRSVLGRRQDLGGPGQDSFSSKVETGDGEVVPFPGADEDDAALETYIRGTTSTTWHVCGTCKMRADGDAMAVVDQRGKVQGLEGLYVADASIMPEIVSCNTNLTAIMIGERVAVAMR